MCVYWGDHVPNFEKIGETKSTYVRQFLILSKFDENIPKIILYLEKHPHKKKNLCFFINPLAGQINVCSYFVSLHLEGSRERLIPFST